MNCQHRLRIWIQTIRHNLSASEPYQLKPIDLDYIVNLRYSQGYEQQIETQRS